MEFEFTTADETKDCIYLDVTLDAYSGKIIYFYKSYSYGDKSKNKNETPLDKKKSLDLAEKAASTYMTITLRSTRTRWSAHLNIPAV